MRYIYGVCPVCAYLQCRLIIFDFADQLNELSEDKEILEHSLHSKERTLELLNTEVAEFHENIARLQEEKRNADLLIQTSEDGLGQLGYSLNE